MKNIFMLGFFALYLWSNNGFTKMSDHFAAYVPGEILIKLRPGFKERFSENKLFKVEKKLNLLSGQFLLLKSHSKSTPDLVHDLESMAEVEYAEPNYIYRISDASPTLEGFLASSFNERFTTNAPIDPLYGKLWGLNNTGSNEPDRNGGSSSSPGEAGADIQAEKAWSITLGSKKVVVAVIDTGIDYTHPDLSKNIWVNENEIPSNNIDDDRNGYVDDYYGWNAQKDNGNPMDGNAHGTHCAGTIGAEHNNGIGVAGVMSKVSLMAVKFLSDEGSGTLADAVEAIDYATKMNVDVMSNSWGGGGFSQALLASIKKAKERGIVFVAASGNESNNSDTRPSYPASYLVENIISVASHTAQDSLSSFSNFGKRTVHVAAPGSNILSSTPNGDYKVFSGTSMATPHVSGVVGLLLSETGRLPVDELRKRIMETSIPVGPYRKTTVSGGRVSAYNFLTDTRIPRPGPDDSAWRVEALSEVFETTHPYSDNLKKSKSYSFPGAKYVKLIVEKYDTEPGYDILSLKDAKGVVVEKLSGSGQNYETEYAETDSITVEFLSDSSQSRWGVVIKEAKVIY
jgi:thermitase